MASCRPEPSQRGTLSTFRPFTKRLTFQLFAFFPARRLLAQLVSAIFCEDVIVCNPPYRSEAQQLGVYQGSAFTFVKPWKIFLLDLLGRFESNLKVDAARLAGLYTFWL